MKKLLLSFLLAIQPAFATNYIPTPNSIPIIYFPAGQQYGASIVPGNAVLNAATYDIYTFTPVNGDNNPANYSNQNGVCSYLPPTPPTPPPSPDYRGFLLACDTDPNAPNYPIAMIYCQILANKDLTKAQLDSIVTMGTTAITSAYGATVAASIIKVIKGYLTTYNIPF
jgi:hypothetical protein